MRVCVSFNVDRLDVVESRRAADYNRGQRCDTTYRLATGLFEMDALSKWAGYIG